MPTVVATPKDPNANSFVTVAEIDTFADARLESDLWTNETDDDQKARAAIQATSLLDPRGWRGTRTTQEQRLAWPRMGVYDSDGWYVDQDTIPRGLKDGTAEFAILLHAAAASGGDPQAVNALDEFTELKVGEITLKMRGPGETSGLDDAGIPPSVELYVGEFLLSGGSRSTIVLQKA